MYSNKTFVLLEGIVGEEMNEGVRIFQEWHDRVAEYGLLALYLSRNREVLNIIFL